MDTWTQILVEWGYWGLFVGSFVAGTVLPFSSEALLVVMLHWGIDPFGAVVVASLGNTIGGMTCYWIGTKGNARWILRMGVTEEKLQRAQRFMNGRGALMAFFGFLPGIGSAIGIALGLIRSNLWITTLAMLVGKVVRYVLIVLAYEGIISIF